MDHIIMIIIVWEHMIVLMLVTNTAVKLLKLKLWI